MISPRLRELIEGLNPFVSKPLDGLLPARIAKLITVTPSGCWLFAGKWTTGNGYGKTFWAGSHRVLHRVVWTILVGPICPGFKLDHVCRVRACCNPLHLDPVPDVVNVRRGLARLFKPRAECRASDQSAEPAEEALAPGLAAE